MQSHRIGKQTAALLPFAVHLRVFEAMLTCLLPGLVIPFDPLYTSKHFCLPVGRTKKRAAVNLVESLFQDRKNEEPFESQCEQFLKEQQGMEGSEDFVESFIDDQMSGFPGNSNKPLLQVSPQFVNYFKSCDKKDDLSDCLLQALAFYDLVVENRKQSRMWYCDILGCDTAISKPSACLASSFTLSSDQYTSELFQRVQWVFISGEQVEH